MAKFSEVPPCHTRRADVAGRYRYRLERYWGKGPWLCMLGINPSTADANEDDPTLRRMMTFAYGFGYGGVVVGNPFAYRTPSPKLVKTEYDKGVAVIGTDNMLALEEMIADAPTVVLAWGQDVLMGSPYGKELARQIVYRCRQAHVPTRNLGLNQDGSPRHPLYLDATTPLSPFPDNHPLRSP